METAETNIWVIAIIMLISFVFNWLKKKRGDNEEIGEVETDGTWGVNEIIQQFEEEFGAQKAQPHKEPQFIYEEEPVQEPVQEAVPERDYENESHSAFEHVKKSHVEDVVSEEQIDVEYDLKQMIIHDTILNRPKY